MNPKYLKIQAKIKNNTSMEVFTGCQLVNEGKFSRFCGRIPMATCPRTKKQRSLIQIVWESENGPIPEGFFVYRVCKNASCVNPQHLRLCEENARQSMEKEQLIFEESMEKELAAHTIKNKERRIKELLLNEFRKFDNPNDEIVISNVKDLLTEIMTIVKD